MTQFIFKMASVTIPMRCDNKNNLIFSDIFFYFRTRRVFKNGIFLSIRTKKKIIILTCPNIYGKYGKWEKQSLGSFLVLLNIALYCTVMY